MAFRLVPAEGVLSGSLTGRYTLTGTYMQSSDYVAGVSGWAIFGDGSAEFNNGTFRGLVEAAAIMLQGTSGQVLVYSGAPAAGNLIGSISGAAGTDGEGNAFLEGTAAYVAITTGSYQGTYALRLGDQSFPFGTDFAAISWANQTTPGHLPPAIVAETSSAGSAVEMDSGTGTSAATDASVGVLDSLAGPALFPRSSGSLVEIVGTNILLSGSVVPVQPGSTPAALETWHTAALDANWSTSGQTPQYRLLADGNVQVKGGLTHTTGIAATGVAINSGHPLPAGYRPASPVFFKSSDTFRAGILAQVTGVLTAFGDGAVTLADLVGTYWPGS